MNVRTIWTIRLQERRITESFEMWDYKRILRIKSTDELRNKGVSEKKRTKQAKMEYD